MDRVVEKQNSIGRDEEGTGECGEMEKKADGDPSKMTG